MCESDIRACNQSRSRCNTNSVIELEDVSQGLPFFKARLLEPIDILQRRGSFHAYGSSIQTKSSAGKVEDRLQKSTGTEGMLQEGLTLMHLRHWLHSVGRPMRSSRQSIAKGMLCGAWPPHMRLLRQSYSWPPRLPASSQVCLTNPLIYLTGWAQCSS